MKVKFLKPDLNSLPRILNLGYSQRTEFHMRRDTIYTVYGISMWKYVLHYLLLPDNISLPDWYPADLFEVVDGRIPPNWYFHHLMDNDPSEIKFELGYREMAQSANHYVDLIERETDAVRVFLARKEEIENAFST
jgi:hypothetical protein